MCTAQTDKKCFCKRFLTTRLHQDEYQGYTAGCGAAAGRIVTTLLLCLHLLFLLLLLLLL
jgi:hypothetical protein